MQGADFVKAPVQTSEKVFQFLQNRNALSLCEDVVYVS